MAIQNSWLKTGSFYVSVKGTPPMLTLPCPICKQHGTITKLNKNNTFTQEVFL